ncbi:hypothetical protein [Sphingobium boeckii]|uniref:Uncharacterized protein n=1 Tax=Sphingobium boeckii TaxID=1082345 RepID=A0A7W9ED48_9SPHN|nr:hypothetical protein [Sphingobium boeckii]MBB5684574.1 hypothetical protein [Sphingobium boeckii]
MNWILLAGSLAGILGLALAAHWLGLGSDPRIRDEDHARRLAQEAHCGFEPVDIAVDRGGYAALLKDAGERHMLIRAHGNHFVSRMIEPPFFGRLNRRMLTIRLPERTFGEVTMDLGDRAAIWASGLRRAGGMNDG